MKATKVYRSSRDQDNLTIPKELSRKEILSQDLSVSANHKSDSAFLRVPLAEWKALIEKHPAGKHPWYEYLAEKGSLYDLKRFLWEESQMPLFVPILESIKERLDSSIAVSTLKDNIQDEREPVPHANLFESMLNMVLGSKEHYFMSFEALEEANAVFSDTYSQGIGFSLGVLFATETMVPWRAARVLKALCRYQFNENALAFFQIHSVCDVHHSEEWLEKVIEPELEIKPELLQDIVRGIKVRLSSSKRYLDYIFERSLRESNRTLQRSGLRSHLSPSCLV